MRRFILSTLLLSASMSLTLHANEAHAQRVVNMNPKTDWAVKQIASKANAFDSYCAVAREFPRSTILTFAKNNKAEASIALDFQGQDFNTSRFFTMTMDAGFDETRSFEVRPVSENGFVVRLGRDDPFFSALLRSKEMAVELDDRTFNFNLADIEKGQYELDTCLAALTMPAAGEELSAPGAPQVVQNDTVTPPPPSKGFEQAATRMREGKLREELESVRKENASLRTQLSKSIVKPKAKEEGSATIINLSGKNALLELEIERLRAGLAKAETNNQFNDDAMRKELMRLRTENAVLQADVEAVRSGLDATSVMDKKLTALTEERNHLQEMLNKSTGNFQALSEAAALRKTEHKKMQEENEWLRLDMQRSKAQLEDAQLALEREKEEMAHLRMRMNDLQAANTNLQQTRISALGNDTDHANTIAVLREENVELKQAVHDMNRAQEQFAFAEKTIDNLRAENNNLIMQIADMETAAGGDIAELSRMQSENQALQQRITDLEAQKNAMQSAAPAASGAPQNTAELEQLRAQNQNLNRQIQTLRRNVQNAQNQTNQLRQRVTSLESTNQTLQQEKQELTQSLLAAQTTTEEKQDAMRKLESRVVRLQNRNSDLVGSLALRGAKPKPSSPVRAVGKTLAGAASAAAEIAATDAPEVPDQTMALLKAGASPQGPADSVRASVDREEIAAAPADVTTLSREALRARQEQRQRAYEEIEAEILQGTANLPPTSLSPAQHHERALKQRIAEAVPSIEAPEPTPALQEATEEASKTAANLTEAVLAANEPVASKADALSAGDKQPAPEAVNSEEVAAAPAPAEPRFKFDMNKFKTSAKPVSPAAPKAAAFTPTYQIENLLLRAGLRLTQAPKAIENASGSARLVHQWKTQNTFGSSEQRPLTDLAQFERDVQSYLRGSRSRCQGTFSVIPAARTAIGQERMSGYEVSCQSAERSMSASLLFFSKDKSFNVIAHETKPSLMASAVEARDKIMRILRGASS